jgi:hypothetical protein
MLVRMRAVPGVIGSLVSLVFRVSLGVSLGACYRPSPPAGAPCGPGESCPAPLSCQGGFCVGDGTALDDALAIDVSPLDSCTALTCDGDMLVGCGTSRACTDGCLVVGTPHCARIRPSNGVSWDLVIVPGSPLVLGPGMHTFDTDTGVLTSNGVPVALPVNIASIRVGTMRVLATGDLSISDEATLAISGTAALVLLVDGNATIAGTLQLVAGCTGGDPSCGGPGGGQGGRSASELAAGCGAGEPGGADVFNTSEAGGGGGGHGEDGDNSGGIGPGEGAHGTACGNVTLEPLLGGSGGGAGGVTMDGRFGGRGGGGGGALQLTVSGTLDLTGELDAGGAGGENGLANGMTSQSGGGGGGGAGGGLLLEAAQLAISGTVTANGGAGGGNSSQSDGNGQAGRHAGSCAQGGAANLGNSPGGRGGCRQQPASSGGANQDRGGGGGGVGRIRFNFRQRAGAGDVSPNETTGTSPLE